MKIAVKIFLINFWAASILSVLGSGLGAVSAFLIGRYLARTAVEKWASRNQAFGRIRLVYTYSGRLTGSLAGAGSGARTPGEWGLLGVGLAASVTVFFYLRRLAQAELRSRA